jgi:flagellar biosynthesis protein FliQ
VIRKSGNRFSEKIMLQQKFGFSLRAGSVRGGGAQMTGPEVMDVARDAIVTLILVTAPLMLVGLIVGVAVSLVQALTQIQEATLVFVPKILAIFVTLLIALPFMADTMHANFVRIAARIGGN